MRRSFAPGLADDEIDDAPEPEGATSTLDELRTEFTFELPRGYLDRSGRLHRNGVMRLATARDELVPLMDDRVRENPAYLTVVLLARVITELGTLADVHAGVVEGMFATDLAFLQDLYRRINTEGHTRARVVCPACKHEMTVDLAGGRLGGIVTNAPEHLYEEVAFVAFHFHWRLEDILDLEHITRRRFVREIERLAPRA